MIKKTYNNHKETIHNFLWRSIEIFWKQWINFLIFILCAKLLSPHDFWIYSYLLTIIFFVVIFSDFWISQSTSKYVSEYSVKNPEKIKYILFNSLLVILWLSIFSIIIFIVFAYFYFYEYFKYILFLLPLIFLAPAIAVYDWVYRWLKKFKELSILTTIVWLLSITFIYFFVNLYWIIWALIAQSLFYLILLFALIYWYREISFWIDKWLIKKIIKYWIIIWISNIWYFLYTKIDILVLWQYWYINEIWYYEIVNKIFEILIMPILILGTVVAPNSTRNIALWKIEYIKNKIIKESIFLFISWLIVAFIWYFVLPYLFSIFFEEYNQALLVNILSLLLIIIPFRFYSSFVTVWYITPIWYAKIVSILLILFWILNLILDIVLVKYYWFIGIIYSTVIVNILYVFTKDISFYLSLKKTKNN